MSSSERTEQALPGDWLAKWQEENIDLMRRGFEVIAGTGAAWWNLGRKQAGEGFSVPWDALFNGWKKFLAASPSQSFLKDFGVDSDEASKSWQERQARLFEAWRSCLEGIARVYEPGGEAEKRTRKALDACRESSAGIVAVCRDYTEAQTREFFKFLESLQAGSAGTGDRRQAAKKADKEDRRKAGK